MRKKTIIYSVATILLISFFAFYTVIYVLTRMFNDPSIERYSSFSHAAHTHSLVTIYRVYDRIDTYTTFLIQAESNLDNFFNSPRIIAELKNDFSRDKEVLFSVKWDKGNNLVIENLGFSEILLYDENINLKGHKIHVELVNKANTPKITYKKLDIFEKTQVFLNKF